MWSLALVAALNVAATIESCLDPFLERRERLNALSLIWLVPILGSVLTLARAWRLHKGFSRRPDSEALGDTADLLGVPVVSRSRLSRSSDDSWGDGGDD